MTCNKLKNGTPIGSIKGESFFCMLLIIEVKQSSKIPYWQAWKVSTISFLFVKGRE
jgi:hypothetical protein